VAKGGGLLRSPRDHRTGLKSNDFGPVFSLVRGWRWLPIDGPRTEFGHTSGHIAADALKIIIPSRKATKQYLGEEADDEDGR
jgi:hypothetical protein